MKGTKIMPVTVLNETDARGLSVLKLMFEIYYERETTLEDAEIIELSNRYNANKFNFAMNIIRVMRAAEKVY